jgi:hypothetical protein
MTKLSSSLPKDYAEDGLGSINRDLVAHPTDTQVVIALLDCKSITTDVDSGLDIATARILHIEPLREHEADQAREMLVNAQERRTGQRALPIVDGDTGEILRNGTGVTFINGGKA